MKTKWVAFLFSLIVLLSGLVGCASTSSEGSEEQNVSSIPWNRPQKWEGGGALGGLMGGQ